MKLKHGYVNPATGLVFVGYYKSCKNGEWWLDADSFAKRKEKRNQFIDNWNFNAANMGGVPTQGMQQ